MTIRNLDALRHPRSVAVIGASGRLGSVGQVVLANILSGDFAGQVHAVNPHRFDLDGAEWAPSIEALPGAPDLAIVVTPAITVPDVIARLGARGTKAAVVISAGIRADNGLRQAMLDAARPHLLRIIGPAERVLRRHPSRAGQARASLAERRACHCDARLGKRTKHRLLRRRIGR
jgi:acetyltransferase